MNNSTAVQFIVIAIAAGTPLVYAAVGEIVAERSGVMNLGIEGMMLLSAVTAYWGSVASGTTWVGLCLGTFVGAAMAGVHAVWSISLRANQIVSGIALVIVGAGLSSFIGESGDEPLTIRPSEGVFGPVFTGGPADWPIVGPIVFGQNVLVYLSWLLVLTASFYLFRTRTGLNVRAVGEDPASADASGVPVARVRYVHVVIGGAAAGMAGSYLTLALFGAWQSNLSAGSGWIAFALVIFSGWNPALALVGAYAFGALTSLGFNLQLLEVPVPSAVLSMLPFLLTLVALFVVSNTRAARWLNAPSALAAPYWREDR